MLVPFTVGPEEAHPRNYVCQWWDDREPWTAETMFRWPGQPKDLVRDAPRKKVCVIGGGIAGLVAAYELVQANQDVALFEASPRFGGRILTERFGDTHAEFGAMRIPEVHAAVLHYINEFPELGPPRRFIERNLQGYLCLRGDPLRQQDYKQLRTRYRARDFLWKALPGDTLEKMFLAFLDMHDIDIWQVFQNELSGEVVQLLDELNVWQFMCGDSVNRLADGTDPGLPHLTQDEWEYIGRGSGIIWDEKGSALESIIDAISFETPNKVYLPDGMDTLTDAFVHRLRGVVRRHSPIRRVEVGLGGVSVWYERLDGTRQRCEFDYVVCASPADATSRIEWEPKLPSTKFEALTNLSYQSSAKALAYCRRRFWEADDQIYGGSTFTDLSIQQSWYPSDNSQPMPDTSRPLRTAPLLSVTSPDLFSRTVAPSAWGPEVPSRSEESGVFTAAYLWGSNAGRFASMSDGDREQLVLTSLKKIHGGGVLRDIEDLRFWCWDAEAVPGGGAFAFFGTGEHRRYQAALAAPLRPERPPEGPNPTPRVFFAGEHLAICHAWIQSAVQTALAASIDVLEEARRAG